MHDTFISIKEIPLKNNCPECYSNDGLRLTFKQRFVETTFYKSITSDVEHVITCKTCNTIIYPVQWTDDIERILEYQKKAFIPKKASTYLKKASWIIIGLVGFVIASVIYVLVYTEL